MYKSIQLIIYCHPLLLFPDKTIYLQVVDAPKFVDALLKSKICPKKKLPYGDEENDTYYDPNCIEGVYSCRDICGIRCRKECQKINHLQTCDRGKLPNNFMYCASQSNSEQELEYLTYSLVIDKNIKEGKKIYKKMDQVKIDLSQEKFKEKFKTDFQEFSKHKLEDWMLNNLKHFGSKANSQKPHNLFMISDFAQNIKLSKKMEVSEEYFHKQQVAVFGSVSTSVSNGSHKNMSQITSSDVKYVYFHFNLNIECFFSSEQKTALRCMHVSGSLSLMQSHSLASL